MNADREFHEYAEIFPMMGPDEIEKLAASMHESGYDESEPIYTLDEKILDGRNRFTAAIMADIEPVFKEYRGDDALNFVVQRNLHRRHLTESQRSMVATKLAKLRKEDGRPNKSANLRATQEDAGKALSVSTRSVTDARKVDEHGTPELKESVVNGTVKVSDAAKIADKPPEVQRKAVKAKKEGKAKTVAKAAEEIEKETTEEPVEAPKDRYGDEWPDRCLPHVIDASKELNTFRLSVIDLTKESRRLNNTKAANHVDFSGITHSLEQIKTLCNAGRPEYICPYCNGTGKDKDRIKCKPCKGDGWVNASIYDNTEKASKRKRA